MQFFISVQTSMSTMNILVKDEGLLVFIQDV